MADVACVATLDSKADEPGLVAFCERHRLRLMTFSAEEVQACFARGSSDSSDSCDSCDSCDSSDSSLRASDVVQEHAGVPGVCEPCALLASPGGALVRAKHAADGVTVAIAVSSADDGAQRVPPQVQV
jgi:cobalamin biosynthesis protein CbiG